MPGKLQVINIVVIVLQYSLIILVYYFLYRVVKFAAQDLTMISQSEVASHFKCQQDAQNINNTPAKLIVIDSGQTPISQTTFIIEENWSVGRSSQNDLVIDDTFVSHEHACISKFKHNYLLADLNSTNGTLLNGHRINGDTALSDGDMIKVGAVTLKFER